MPQFLAEFAEILAGTEQDVAPSRAWDKLLPRLCAEAAGSAEWVGGLWIADDDAAHTYTLWSRVASQANVGPTPPCVSVSVANQEPEELQRALRDARAEWVGETAVNWPHLQAYPLVYTPKSLHGAIARPLGIIGIATNRLAADAATQDRVDRAVATAGSWLRLNREARVTRALDDLLGMQDKIDSPESLADILCEFMGKHAHARTYSALYMPDGAGLVRLDSGPGPRREDEQSPLAIFHNGIGPGRRPDGSDGGGDEWVMRFNADGEMISTNWEDCRVTLRDVTGIDVTEHRSSVLIYRIRERRSGRHNLRPAIVTLVLVCQPYFDDPYPSVAGAFSLTHRRIIEHGVNFFCYAYALQLQRHQMAKIQSVVTDVLSVPPDIMDERTDSRDLEQFADLARTALPSVIDAVIVRRHEEKNEFNHRYYDRREDPGVAPPWLDPKQLDRLLQIGNLAFSTNDFFHCYEIGSASIEGTKSWLILYTKKYPLYTVEHHLAKQIVAETAAELNRYLNRPRWSLQLAEVRHNLRSIANSVNGKASKLASLYWPVKRSDAPPEEVYNRLIVQAGFHKVIADMEFSANELLILTENMQTLSGGSDRAKLQVSEVNLLELLKFCIRLFVEETKRRSIKININISEQPNLIYVSADKKWIHILLFNLIENAVKYSRRGGVVEISLWAEAGFWRLRVTNEGKYIPSESMKKIFDPYYRVEAEQGEQMMPGTGLGLYSVKKIVEMHQLPGSRPPGGQMISVVSTIIPERSTSVLQNAKTSFTISIPLTVRGAE